MAIRIRDIFITVLCTICVTALLYQLTIRQVVSSSYLEDIKKLTESVVANSKIVQTQSQPQTGYAEQAQQTGIQHLKKIKEPSVNKIKLTQGKIDDIFKETTKQDDSTLIQYIAQKFVDLPSYKSYKLKDQQRRDFSRGQSGLAEKLLPNKAKGFYVECGALDGESRSNSLYFERERHWDGLLIEADPKNYKDVLARNRKAYTMNACLSPNPYPSKLKYRQAKNVGKAIHTQTDQKAYENANMLIVECFPLYSIMLAVKRTTIDFFSLDVEGLELPILKTIPFDKLTIKVLTVEFVHGDEGSTGIVEFLQSKDYILKGKVTRSDGTANDVVFMRKDFDTKDVKYEEIRNFMPAK